MESVPSCKMEDVNDDNDEALHASTVLARQQQHLHGDRLSSSNSLRSSGGFSQASQSTASSSCHSFVAAHSPTPPHLPARSGPLTLQLATALHGTADSAPFVSLPAPPAPQPAAATTLTAILDPHLLHLLYLYSSRALSPFDEQSIWSCFLSHLQQPDPNQPGRLLPLCDKQYQRSSRRSFKNHVWKCLCRHFPTVASFTYSEFRHLCATDRTVMAGFHAVTLFPRPQKKRRSTAELSDGERWLCPHGCGQEYRNTSSTSIGRHLRKECRLKDMSEEEKREERATLEQHEREKEAYRALQAVSDVAAEADAELETAARLEPIVPLDTEMAQIKRMRLSDASVEAMASASSAPMLAMSLSAPSSTNASAMAATTTALLPTVPTFSPSSTMPHLSTQQLPVVHALNTAASFQAARAYAEQQQQRQQQQEVSAVDGTAREGVRVMSTAEIAQLEAQLMDTMQTQLVVDRLLAGMTQRAALTAANNRNASGGGPLPHVNSAGEPVISDAVQHWRLGGGSGTTSELTMSASQPTAMLAAAALSPPPFVSMSNAPSPCHSHARQLQRPSDASASKTRLSAPPTMAASSISPPLPSRQSPISVDRSLPPLASFPSAASSLYSALPPLPPLSSAPPLYPQLTSDEAVAVIRQQLSLRCVSFLSEPGRDVKQLLYALLQVVAGLPVALGSALVHDTLRALSASPSQQEASGNAADAFAAMQRHKRSGSSPRGGVRSNSSSPQSSPSFHQYSASPSTQSTSTSSSASYAGYSSGSSASLPSLLPSASSILQSPLSMLEAHRLLNASTPPLETLSAAASPFASGYASPLSALMPSLPAMPSSQQQQQPHGGASSSLAQLHEWLDALPLSTAPLYRQLLAPATAHAATVHDAAGSNDADEAHAASLLLRPLSQSHAHMNAQPHMHSHAAAVGQ